MNDRRPFPNYGSFPRPRRVLALRGAVVVSVAAGALALLQRGRTLQADAPPAATLISPNGGTVAIGKPYFRWNEVTTATEYRLKVDNSLSVTVIVLPFTLISIGIHSSSFPGMYERSTTW